MADLEIITIAPGCEVTMHFSLSLKDGTVADKTEDDEPMCFRLGDGSLIHGLELAIMGLKIGDKQSIELDPINGFGFSDPDSIHDMPFNEFDPNVELKEGMIIGFSTPSGDEIPGTILSVDADNVSVDFNHPLAGKDVIFDVNILDIKAATSASDAENGNAE